MKTPVRWRRIATVTAAITTTVAALAACGGGGEGGAAAQDGGLPAEIKLAGVRDLTGPVAYAGVGGARGGELAVDEINQSGFLGDGVKLSLKETDTAGEIDKASSLMTKVMADRDVAAILGPTQGQQAATVAPLVERTKVPTVFTQAGSDGVVIGDYTFRATAPMSSYYHLASKYLAKVGKNDISVLYNATFPTFAEIGDKVLPGLAEESGLKIVSKTPVQTTTQDFTTPVRAIAGKKPDAVVMLLTAPQSVTALTQLRQAGYDGQVVATSVQGAGNIAQAGKHAEGLVYPTDFSTASDGEKAKKFVDAFKKRFDAAPDPYAAEGYDAVWWIARAIKASGSASRDGIQQGMQKVAAEGFDGVMGRLTFKGNDMRVPGVFVQWDGTREKLIANG